MKVLTENFFMIKKISNRINYPFFIRVIESNFSQDNSRIIFFDNSISIQF